MTSPKKADEGSLKPIEALRDLLTRMANIEEQLDTMLHLFTTHVKPPEKKP